MISTATATPNPEKTPITPDPEKRPGFMAGDYGFLIVLVNPADTEQEICFEFSCLSNRFSIVLDCVNWLRRYYKLQHWHIGEAIELLPEDEF